MTDKKDKLIIFSAGFALRLFLFLSILVLNPYHLDFFNNPNWQGADQGDFLKLTKNIVDHHVFSFADAAPYLSDMFRTPLFPLFMAISYWLTGQLLLFSILNALLSAVTGVLVYLLAQEIFNDKRIAFWSGLIFNLLPYGAYLSLMAMADNLFAFLFVASLLFLVRFFQKPNHVDLSWAAIFLGLTVLTRPVIQYLVIAIIILIVWRLVFYQMDNRRKFACVWSFILLLILVVSPWLVRNKLTFNKLELSSLAGYHMFVSWVGPYRAYMKDHISRSEEARQLYQYIYDKYGKYGSEAMYDPVISDSLGKEAKAEILNNISSYAPFHALSGLIYFMNNDFLLTLSEVYGVNSGNIYAFEKLFKFDLAGFWNSLASLNILYVLFYFSSYLFIALKNILAGISLIKGWRSQPWIAGLFLAILIYFPLIVGPEGHARFRYPVEPILVILAVEIVLNSKLKNQISKLQLKTKNF